MSLRFLIIFLTGCLDFSNNFTIDRDGDGLSIYQGDCDDNDVNIGLEECTDKDGDGQAQAEGDCDDSNPKVYVGAGYLDDATKCMLDKDGDGFGDNDPPAWVLRGRDCDDDDPLTHPNGTEVCDGVDNDCDEEIDDEGSADAQTLYLDGDADGFGRDNLGVSIKSCVSVEGYVENNEDCDDGRETVNPSASEVCDGLDNDCDDLTDSEDDSVDETTGFVFYVDGDGDGFGDKSQEGVYGCSLSEGLADNEGDCDDGNDEIHPDALEICDSVDNDCDQKIDDMDVVFVFFMGKEVVFYGLTFRII